MFFQPDQRRAEVDAGQVHHQVDRPTAAPTCVPIHELGARYRQRAPFRVPFASVAPVPHRAAEGQDGLQRRRAGRGGTAAEVGQVHAASLSPLSSSLTRKLRQFFMLIVWPLAVSRSSKAEVSCGFFRNDPHSLKPRFEVIRVVLVLCRICISVKNSPTCAASISTYPTSSITRQS